MAKQTAPTYKVPTIERQSASAAPVTGRYPRVIGGVCEKCGVMDRFKPSEEQYTLCPHFRGIGLLRCSYCDEAKNPMEVIRMSDLSIAVSPTSTAERPELVVWCDSYECSKKHRARFDRSK